VRLLECIAFSGSARVVPLRNLSDGKARAGCDIIGNELMPTSVD